MHQKKNVALNGNYGLISNSQKVLSMCFTCASCMLHLCMRSEGVIADEN